MRRAALIAVFLAAAGTASAEITGARYDDPTTRYDHGILGDAVEYGALVLTMSAGPARRITLPTSRVFEDTAPRLADLDGDGRPEVIVVETDLSTGARLSVYDENGLVAATPHIGRRHRWLAPVGAADLDGDGAIEIAYVDRPHLAKTLRVWRFKGGALTQVAAFKGVTNHRIGDPLISGGVRDCGQGPEMIVASADWSRLVAVTFDGRNLTARDLARYSAKSELAALACDLP